jgi:hypothetical protein
MSKTILGLEHAELATKLINTLRENESDGVKQQVAIELLVVSHAIRMGDKAAAIVIADGVHKHVLQLIEQTFCAFAEHAN